MVNSIGGVGNLQSLSLPLETPGLLTPGSDTGELSFQNLLFDSLQQVNSMQQSAQGAIEENLAGGDITQVEVFAAVKKADLALRMLLQMRNKIMEAYNEIKQLRM